MSVMPQDKFLYGALPVLIGLHLAVIGLSDSPENTSSEDTT